MELQEKKISEDWLRDSFEEKREHVAHKQRKPKVQSRVSLVAHMDIDAIYHNT